MDTQQDSNRTGLYIVQEESGEQKVVTLHDPIVLGPHVLRAIALRKKDEARRIKEEGARVKREEKQRRKQYERRVRSLTKEQDLHTLPGIHLRGKGYDLDHKISISVAYELDWPAELAASIDNLQLLPSTENNTKKIGCYSSLESRHLPMAA